MTGRIIRNVLVVLVALLWLVPTWLVVVNAFTPSDKYTGAPRWWFASGGLFTNIRTAFSTAAVGQGLVNTLIYAVCGAALAVLIAVAASFAVTVMPVKRPALWFWVIFIGTVL